MTRTDELFSMNGATLIQLADKLGVKAACNKTRTQLKEKKENVVNRILEAEKKIADAKAEKQIEKAVKIKEAKAQPRISDKPQITRKLVEANADASISDDTPIKLAESFIKTYNYQLTFAKNNVGVCASNKKRFLDIWGRKNHVRIYVSSENELYQSLPKDLYFIKGVGSGKLNISIYVEKQNIERVLTHLLKEEK